MRQASNFLQVVRPAMININDMGSLEAGSVEWPYACLF